MLDTNKYKAQLVFKKHSILLVITLSLLTMLLPKHALTQFKDTLVLNESAVDKPIFYSASDSIYSDLRKKQIHLYNNAKVDNGEIKIDAGYILIDLNKNEVYATHLYDKDSNRIQLPKFSDGSEELTASSIRYNFNTEKGYIEEVAIKQDENYLYMEIAKRHANEEVHFKKGRFTTCDLEEPHYHFQLSKAVMIPGKRIVSGPMNLWVKGVPTPLGLPFSVIPQVEEKSKGLIFPEIELLSSYGFGLRDLGYYIPINDRLQTTFYGTLYSRGSWGIRNQTDYAKRYNYRGKFELGFQQLKSGFPDNINNNKVNLAWIHNKDPKSSPYWRFTSNVNFISDNNSKTDIDQSTDTYFQNSFNSDINLSRSFPGKPIAAGAKISLRQNGLSKNISLTAPIINVNVSRVFPFKKLVTGNGGWAQVVSRLGVTYNFEGQNRTLFGDTLLDESDFSRIADKFQNGISQTVGIQTTAGLFKNTWKLTPSINYGNKINFQQISKSYDAVNNTTLVDTLAQYGMSHSLSFNTQLTTTIFSYYKFIGKKEPLLRHVLTPSFTFSYIPNLAVNITDSIGVDMAPVTYSPFEQSLYSSRANTGKDQALLRFGLNNTFELKRKSDKDTITGFKKTRIIDALAISGSYDFSKDSMNLSDITISMRINPIPWLNFVANSSFSPYGWTDSTGTKLGKYASTTNGTLGRFISNNLSTSITFTSKESRKKLNTNVGAVASNWNSDYEYFLLHPERVVSFEIPWKVSLSHVYQINANQDRTIYNPDKWNQVQTLMLNGDVSFTKRWKLVTAINFDLKSKDITNARFGLTRDMHCWALAFNWTPIGGNKSFLFSIRSTSKLFTDAKLELRKPPAFL